MKKEIKINFFFKLNTKKKSLSRDRIKKDIMQFKNKNIMQFKSNYPKFNFS